MGRFDLFETTENSVVGNVFDWFRRGVEETKKSQEIIAKESTPQKGLEIAKSFLVEPFARAAASITLSALGGKELLPTGKGEQFFLGKEPVKSIGERTKEAEKTLVQSGTPEITSKVLAPIGVLGLTALDLAPFGGSEKNLAKTLLKETSEDATKVILRKAGIAENFIDTYAPLFTKSTELRTTNKLLDTLKFNIGRVSDGEKTYKIIKQEGIREIKGTPVKIVDGVDTFIHKGTDGWVVSEASTGRYLADSVSKEGAIAKAKFNIDNVGENKFKQLLSENKLSTIPPELESLAQEARKYKSAEEFVRGQTNAVRQGGIEKGGAYFSTEGSSTYYDLQNPKALKYNIADARLAQSGTPEMRAVLENAKKLKNTPEELKRINDALKADNVTDNFVDYILFDEVPSIKKSAERLKFDGVKIFENDDITDPSSVFIWNIDKIKSKSQLTDIYNQATKETKTDFLPKISGKETKLLSPEEQALKTQLEGNKVVGEATPLTESIAQPLKEVKEELPNLKLSEEELKTASERAKIIPPTVRGGITSPELDFTQWKDKSALTLSRETLERNLDSVAGKDAPKLQEFLTSPIRENETARIKYLNNVRSEAKDVVKTLGIKVGSKEDALIQRFGEGNITLEELKKLTPKWENVERASQYFRAKYDELLDSINAARREFDYAPIPKRADYFRHFEELNFLGDQFGFLFDTNKLPTAISGLTEFFKPGKPFTTAELRRLGGAYTESAIKGMDNYLSSISKQLFHIDSVQRVRALEKYIREAGEVGQVTLPNFVANIREYGNLLSGKKAQFDRAFEGLLGRKFYDGMNWLKRKTGANMIAANIGSALTNFIPFTQSLATTAKSSALRGVLDTLTSPFQKSFFKVNGVESDFLIRRFPKEFIMPSTGQKISQIAGSLFNLIDRFTAHSIVAGKFYENLVKGMGEKEAMKLADSYAGKVLADRSIGQLPNLMSVRGLGFVTQFQTEINNVFSFITKDMPKLSGGSKAKLLSSITQFVVYSYLFNTAFEKVVGRRPTFDPIHFALVMSGLEEGDRGYEFQDMVGNLPLVGGFTGGRFPISAGVPNVPELLKGRANLGAELKKPAYFLLPPLGGLQAKKSIEGLNAYLNKKVMSQSGKTKLFSVQQSPENLLRGVFFGKNAFPEAERYYNRKTTTTNNRFNL